MASCIGRNGVLLPPKVVLAAARVDGKRGAVARGRQHVHVVRRGDTLWAVARDTGMDVRTLATMNNMQPGDTLLSISEQFNTTVTAIVEANNLTPQQADSLRVGQELVIP